MSEAIAPEAPPGRRGRPLVAWAVILGLVGLFLYLKARRAEGPSADWLVPMQMQARYAVGAASLAGGAGDRLYEAARQTFDGGPYGQRLRLAVLAGEMVGPSEALDRLRRLRAESAEARDRLDAGEAAGPDRREDEALAGSERGREAAAVLEKLYGGYLRHPKAPPAVGEGEAEMLRERLGWFGDLALGPEGAAPDARARAIGPARRTVVGMIGLLLAGLAALLLGLILIVTWGCFLYAGLTRTALPDRGGNGGVYAETFALYLALFAGLSYLGRFLPERFTGLGMQAAFMLLSLGAVAWPVLRGIPWARVRADLGLYSDRPFRDVIAGVGAYLCAVPMLALALLLVAGVNLLLRRMGVDDAAGTGPSHPLMQRLLHADGWLWAQVVVVVCVLAPLVEETMFRGALYLHLRELPLGGKAPRVAFAVAVSGIVFAVIHPYNWQGVLVLVALATALALAREWRGSLLPSMVTHAIQNGLGTLILWLFVV